ncbi:MAG: holo-ACP synthase [bacterium]|nr:holo-ACP synthase [Myxococcales bacterium]
MIHGIGVDLVDIPAFRRQLQDPASRFAAGVFTPGERLAAQARASADPARHLAARYAAKEAFIKAWSAGRFGQPPLTAAIDLRHIEVVTDHWHRPALRLTEPLAALVGPCRLHLSLSHDGDVATAYVIMEVNTPEVH